MEGRLGCRRCKVRLRVLYVVFITSIFLVSGRAAANTSASPVQATPFDAKLASIGFFDPGFFESQSPSGDSAESLFWKARSFRYVSDGDTDYWQTPQETEARHTGDCEDKALWLFYELKQNGYSNALLVIGKYRQMDLKYHVWVTYTDDSGETIVLDPTIQKRPWTLGNFSGDFYLPLYSFDGHNRYRNTPS